MQELPDSKQGRPPDEFPGVDVPVAFADGVSSYVGGGGISKFYFYRIDPNIWGYGGAVFNPVSQVVMPTNGFVTTAAFFYAQARRMIANNEITQQQWDQAVAAIETRATTGA
jgi:hypothetical protein